jgi:endonuclease-3
VLLNKIPEGAAHSFHTNLIRLGREICKPANPVCSLCPLLKICRFEAKNMTEKKPYKKIEFMLLDNL